MGIFKKRPFGKAFGKPWVQRIRDANTRPSIRCGAQTDVLGASGLGYRGLGFRFPV